MDVPPSADELVDGPGCCNACKRNRHFKATLFTLLVLGSVMTMVACHAPLLGSVLQCPAEVWLFFDPMNQGFYIGTGILLVIYYIECFCSSSRKYLTNQEDSSGGVMEYVFEPLLHHPPATRIALSRPSVAS